MMGEHEIIKKKWAKAAGGYVLSKPQALYKASK